MAKPRAARPHRRSAAETAARAAPARGAAQAILTSVRGATPAPAGADASAALQRDLLRHDNATEIRALDIVAHRRAAGLIAGIFEAHRILLCEIDLHIVFAVIDLC